MTRRVAQSLLAFAALALLALLCGCTTLDVERVQPVREAVTRVSLQIDASLGTMTDEQRSRVRTAFTTVLTTRGLPVVPKGDPEAADLQGTIITYDRGNRGLRYVFGLYGAGWGYFASSWVVKNARGEDIGMCRITASIRMGWFGGSFETLVDESADALRKCLVAGLGPP